MVFDKRASVYVSESSHAENALAEKIRAAQEEVVCDVLLPAATPELLQLVIENAEGFAEAATTKHKDPLMPNVACKEGCAHCCFQLVAISAPETFRIVRYISENFADTERTLLKDRIKQLDKATRGMNSKARVNVKKSCAFLSEDSKCTIYEVRPLACSEFTSFNVQECKRGKRLGFKPFGIIHEKSRMVVFGAVRQGLKDGLEKTLPNADSSWLELTAAVATVLELEDAENDWIRGAEIFKKAHLNAS